MTNNISIGVPTDQDWDALYQSVSIAFNDDSEPAASTAERLVYEPDRFLAARRDGQIVGTAGVLTRRLAIPGGVAAAGHVTFVSVAATARRQGILTEFMRRQFDDIRAAGESFAVLWASEGRIYQRFGYGMAARKLALTVDTRDIRFTAPAGTGRLREGTVEDLRDTIVKIYDEVYSSRPGWSERLPRHVDYRLTDLESSRRGASKLRVVLHEGDNGVDGYALWRVTSKWDDSGPAGEVRLLELVAATDEGYAALWRFLLTVDLTRSLSAWATSMDEPLQLLVDEPRKLNAKVTDALWIRLIDLPAALMARRYAADLDVVFEVSDERIPSNAGRWRLTVTDGTARCESTVDDADLACDVRTLGAAFLGGTALSMLSRAGQVQELRPGTLAAASTAFGWHRTSSAIEVF